MRIAVKYSMDDIQAAIAKFIPLIPLQPQRGPGTAISRLAFVVEFPSHFFDDDAIQMFTDASSINHRPTADHLEPLMPFPAFVVLMMEYREGLRNPKTASWQYLVYTWGSQDTALQEWLNSKFGGYGFKQKYIKPQFPSALDRLARR